MIRIWGRVNSVNVQKALWALAEIDLAYERIDAGLEFGIVDLPAYRTMNPNALVPTMDDDGFVLWESNVVVRYLATKYGMGTLCPGEERGRFTAECWMDWQADLAQSSDLFRFRQPDTPAAGTARRIRGGEEL